jgi:hypothetical protein
MTAWFLPVLEPYDLIASHRDQCLIIVHSPRQNDIVLDLR